MAVTGAEVTAVAKSALPLAKPVGRWLRGRLRPDTSEPSLTRLADALAARVVVDETVLRDQLRSGPDTVMDLDFRATPRFRSAETEGADVLSSIGTYFRRQVPPRRLVVVGEAGAGKTVLAIHLLLDLLRDRAAMADNLRIETPVPVRVNVSGWDGVGHFSEWLASRVSSDYGLNGRIAQALVDTGRILPVLDGLDEMDSPGGEPERALVALDRLNEVPWRNRPVVVMCRTGVYAHIRELRGDAGLHGATTITLQPLSSIDICDYLHRYRDQLGVPEDAWFAVTDRIRQDPVGPLAIALRTPWLLGLAATALRRDRRTATQLSECRDTTEIRDLLFAALIPAAMQGTQRRGRNRDYTEEKVLGWMQRLAQYLERRRAAGLGGNEFALDQIAGLAGTRRCAVIYTVASGVAAAVTFGLATGLAIGSTHGLAFGLRRGLILGLAGGLTPVLIGMVSGDRPAPNRFAWRVPGRSRWRKALAVGLISWLLTWLVTGIGIVLLPGLRIGLISAIVCGAISSLVNGIGMGLVIGLNTDSDDRLTLGQDARRTVHDDLLAGLAFGLAGAATSFAVSLLAGFAVGFRHGFVFGLAVAVAFGLAGGLGGGLGWGQSGGRYATASLLFALTRIFPPRPAQFLEWARNAGLLRVTGVAYQFRHDTYGAWIAANGDDRGGIAKADTANRNGLG